MQLLEVSFHIEWEGCCNYLLVGSRTNILLFPRSTLLMEGNRHIFCLQCADQLGLSRPTAVDRCCPACHASLLNPDDAVSTILSPTEDYKTSVLSGLDPNTIMECAGRALAFWTYQTTQEMWATTWVCVRSIILISTSFYQEYLGKTLTDKYGTLNNQMDKVIHDANSEISNLQTKISGQYQHSRIVLTHTCANCYQICNLVKSSCIRKTKNW